LFEKVGRLLLETLKHKICVGKIAKNLKADLCKILEEKIEYLCNELLK